MNHFVWITTLFLLLSSYALAHGVKENMAKVTLQHGSVKLNLSVHQNSWTERFSVHKLDDAILEQSQLNINDKTIILKLRKIEKKGEHYSIEYISTKASDTKVSKAMIQLPKQLGNVLVTFVRATTQYAPQGKKVFISF